jgi:hypothetical protein
MQFNLPLLDAPAVSLPDDKERELTLALVELLISAARESAGQPAQGGGSEPEVNN